MVLLCAGFLRGEAGVGLLMLGAWIYSGLGWVSTLARTQRVAYALGMHITCNITCNITRDTCHVHFSRDMELPPCSVQ